MDITTFADEKLREELNQRGFDIGPITESTRKVYQNKLAKLLASEMTSTPENEISSHLNGTGERQRSPSIDVQTSPYLNGYEDRSTEKLIDISSQSIDRDHSDDEGLEENSEESRVLSPEEVKSFRRRLSMNTSTNGQTNTSSKRGGLSTFALVLLILVLVVSIILGYNAYSPGELPFFAFVKDLTTQLWNALVSTKEDHI